MMAKYSFAKVISLFHKFGGIRLIWAYSKIGVIWTVIKAVLRGVITRKTAKEIYCSYQGDIIIALQRKYHSLMVERLAYYQRDKSDKTKRNIIWFCWLQGLECAPPIVKACYNSLVKNVTGKEIIVIDDINRKDYIQLPEYIERRKKKGQIPPALFADLIRLELLIKYGGSWIDATVYLSDSNYPKEYLDSEFFMFQYRRPGTERYLGISNWFITSNANNAILKTLRDMLYAYWRDFNCVLEYFIFHRFMDMIASQRQDVFMKMPFGYSPYCHILFRHWHEPFDEDKWGELISQVYFHKLAHQKDERLKEGDKNYYDYILKKELT